MTLSLDLNLSAIGPQNHVLGIQYKKIKQGLLLYVTTGNFNLKHALHIVKLTKEGKDTKYSLKKLTTLYLNERPNTMLSTASIDYNTNVYIALWGDGVLEFYNIENDPLVSTQNSWTVKVSQSLSVFKAPAVKKTKQKRKSSLSTPTPAHVTSVFIKPGYVALIGKNADSNEEYLLTIWDVNYGLIHTTSIINLKELLSTDNNMIELSSNSKEANGYISKSQTLQATVSRDGTSILLNIGGVSVVKPIALEASSLASMIGAHNKTIPYLESTPEENAELSYNNLVDKIKTFDTKKSKKVNASRYVPVNDEMWHRVLGEGDLNEFELIEKMADRTRTPDYTSFMEVYEKYLEVSRYKSKGGVVSLFPLCAQGEEEEEYVNYTYGIAKKNKQWKNLSDYSERQSKAMKIEDLRREINSIDMEHSSLFIEVLSSRCLEDDFLWVPLKRVIETGMLSLQQVPTLFDVVLEKNRLDILLSILKHVQDVSEYQLVRALKYLLNFDKTNLQIFLSEYISDKNGMEVEESDDIVPSATTDSFIDVVIAVPVNAVFLKKHVKSLNTDEVTTLLHYLLSFFQDNLENKHTSKIVNPSIQHIIMWSNQIIECHLLKLVLSQECLGLVSKLHKCVLDFIKLQESMESLRSSIAYYYHHDPTPKDELSDYSVDVLRI